jgi:Type VI secretion system (T6SS), amidase effector protein 4
MSFDALPTFDTMQDNYPIGASPDVLTRLFPGQDTSWIGNTCVIRISQSLNLSGKPIPRPTVLDHGVTVMQGAGDPPNHGAGLHVFRATSTNKWYAFRVREMIPYVTARFGPPAIVDDNRAGSDRRGKFAGKIGLIGFEIHFADATGHMDLWDGATFNMEPDASTGHDYFVMASKIMMWPLTPSSLAPP